MTTLHSEETATAVGVQGRRGDWARLVVASIARVVLTLAVCGMFWASAPALLGWKPTTVMSDSMAPRFFAGDVVVSMPVPAATGIVGRVALVDDPDRADRLRLHRVSGVAADGRLITRGDANPTDDSSPVARSAVHGVGVLRIPMVGLPILWAKTGNAPGLGALAAGAIVLVVLAGADSHLRRAKAAPRMRSRRRRTPRLGLAAGGAVVVVALGVASTGAQSSFAAPTGTPSSSWTASTDFACWSTATAPDNPYFLYRANEALSSTTLVDASGNGRAGAMQAGASRVAGICPPSTTTAWSPSIALNGSASGAVIPASTAAIAAPTTFSIETWFRTTSTTSGKLIGFGSAKTGLSGSYDRQIWMSPTGQVVFGVYPNTVKTISSAAGLNDGAWHHVVATLGGGGIKLYVDGVLMASDSTVTTAQNYSGYWRIGYDNLSGWPSTSTNGYGFIGSMDNVAVYTSALSARQVSSHYAAGH